MATAASARGFTRESLSVRCASAGGQNNIGFTAPTPFSAVHLTIMKSAGKIIALVVVTTLTATAQLSPPPSAEAVKIASEAPSPAKLSPTVAQQLTDKLPKYIAPAPEKPAATGPTVTEAAPAPDPEVLQLEKVKVTPRKRPRLNDEVMMTSAAFNDKLAKEKLSSFDRNFLNKFALPSWFGGVSAAERARDEYNREQHAQMATDTANLARVVEVSDPEQAKVLRDAINRP